MKCKTCGGECKYLEGDSWKCEDCGARWTTSRGGPVMTGKEKALVLLRENDIVSSQMLVDGGVGYRYGSVLHTLNKQGYLIVPIKPKDGPTPWNKGTWWYKMLRDPDCRCEVEGPLFCPVHTSALARQMIKETEGDESWKRL